MGNRVEDLLCSGRRDRVEIIAAIVAMTREPSKITRIMYQVHLSYPALKEYMKIMIRFRLIERHNEAEDAEKISGVWQATEKGLNFLKIYCELLRLMYGEDYLNIDHNLAVACLQFCKEV